MCIASCLHSKSKSCPLHDLSHTEGTFPLSTQPRAISITGYPVSFTSQSTNCTGVKTVHQVNYGHSQAAKYLPAGEVLLLHTEGSKREYRKMLHCKSHEHLPENRSKYHRNISWWKLDLLLYQFLVRLHNGSFYLFLIKPKHFNKCLFGQEYSPSRERSCYSCEYVFINN